MSKNVEGQINLFNYDSTSSTSNFSPTVIDGGLQDSPDGQIRITKMKFISNITTHWEKVFSGYQELRVLTFSYGLSFVEKVMRLFEHGEVIIGFEKVIDKTLADLFALQEYSTNYVCKNAYLQERIENDDFRFFVLKDLISHQKVYLLKADNGQVRTILGSANISEGAWNGDTLESYVVCDDIECYESYLGAYEFLKEMSTDEISKEAVPIKEDGENIEELPVFQKVKTEHAVIIHENTDNEEAESVFMSQKLSEEWRNRIKAVKLAPAKEGKILFDINNFKMLMNSIRKDNIKRKERVRINPPLIIDYDNHKVTYKENEFDLLPSAESIKKDITNLLQYMQGFDLFTKDTVRLKKIYWKALSYMFLSPFIARFRYIGSLYGYEDMRFFPMYMLISGESDAGKTAFVQTAQKLMLNEVPRKLHFSNFSPKPMTSLKMEIKGCPILIDEIVPTYWKYVKEIVKIDDSLIEEKNIHHPTFILLSNDVKGIPPEISKRVIYFNIDNRLNKTDAALNGRKINTLRKNLTNAFYREYLRRMLTKTEQLILDIQNHNASENEEWIPDLFKLSSKTMIEIFEDSNMECPNELQAYSWFDYMGEGVIGEKATAILLEEYEHNRNIFSVNEQKNMLEIDFSCYDDKDSRNKLKVLHDELPAETECKIVGKKAILKLDATQRFTETIFKRKKTFWKWIK